MRDSAVRCDAGISLRNAARLLRVSDNTLRLYEIDPDAVRNAEKRERIAGFYAHLRAFLAAVAA